MTKLLKTSVAAALLFSSLAFAGPKSYQVTGDVTEVKDDVVVVMKGKERFEIAKGAVTDEVKVGMKVKVDYTMTATAIEVKDAKKK
jgi:hypothetical protein